jgi:putative FmdB family regulatory protein
MITYEYACSSCDISFDVMQSIKDDAYTVCPECHKDTITRVLHPPIHIQIVGEPTTIGQLAERNAKHMSQEQMDKAQEAWTTQKTISRTPQERLPDTLPNVPVKDAPEWVKKSRTKTTKQVNKMTPEQTKKYVQSGE